ncbi:hypothetical protein H2C83_00440 [Thermoactinomyces sp. AMNI-1]|uniref:Uncharacterized protein n=2 Tax=Thermoactinomyces mirandus TaxID=2756294 RepID=A0A7W1XPC3_9BACL|nr:hypothetical protein [Thermoactinomyces mirandus]
MEFYLLLPFFQQKNICKKPVLQLMYRMNFITQWILVIQFVTGSSTYFTGNYPYIWIVLDPYGF